MINKEKSSQILLITLIILTALAVIQQWIRTIKLLSTILGQDQRSTSTFIKQLFTTHQVSFMPIVWFVLAHLFLYAGFTALIYFTTRLISSFYRLNKDQEFFVGILLWFITIIFFILANSYYFPHSNFAIPANMLLLKILMLIPLAIIILATITAGIELFRRHWFITTMAMVVLISGIYLYIHPTPNQYATTATKPNVVIIGLDSIRPDHINFYDSSSNIKSPTINNFLYHSAAFGNAYSPLARTYVAWNTILQGEYPKHEHVRDNLINPASLNLSNTLAAILQRHGYQTIFATDSRQFSLITKQFGFDKIASPKMGVYDFVFSLVNDFPLSNLMMNSPVGEWLFPYNYANRMSYVTYQPQTFTALLQRTLAHRTNRPLFLGMHLVLTHWPFFWAKDHQTNAMDSTIEFNNTIERIDSQFATVLKMLRQDGILNHAIVILLSDHGLGLGLPGDRVIAIQNYIGNKQDTKLITKYAYSPVARTKHMPYLTLNTSDGEGTDVLGFNKENNIIFGIRSYGLKSLIKVKNVNQPIALIDITPTILDLLKLAPKKTADGVSLKQLLINNYTPKLAERPLYFETGIWMPLFNIHNLKDGANSSYMLKKLLTLFTFVPKKNLVVANNNKINGLLASKQRGILYKNWFLARYPKGPTVTSAIIPKTALKNTACTITDDYNDDKVICYSFKNVKKPFYVLVNLNNGKWTMELNSNFAKNSPLKTLMKKLKNFYGKEI